MTQPGHFLGGMSHYPCLKLLKSWGNSTGLLGDPASGSLLLLFRFHWGYLAQLTWPLICVCRGFPCGNWQNPLELVKQKFSKPKQLEEWGCSWPQSCLEPGIPVPQICLMLASLLLAGWLVTQDSHPEWLHPSFPPKRKEEPSLPEPTRKL